MRFHTEGREGDAGMCECSKRELKIFLARNEKVDIR